IKNHMQEIAAAGFSAVQTSPAQASYNGAGGAMQLWNSNNSGGGHWWWAYQPTDERLGNWQLGTRDQFAAMCAEAKKYGVKVIVDVVANHTTGTMSAISSGLSSAGGGLGQGQLYHSQGFTVCSNWNNRWNIVQQEMSGGLPDIDTEKQSYQDYLISYLNDCIACGASGFRFDAAKHIGLPDDSGGGDFWPEVSGSRVGGGGVFEYGESLQDGNNMDRLGAYTRYINVTASNYGGSLRSAINSSNLNTNTIMYSNADGAADTSLVKWVESHDNYCNDGTYTISNQRIMWGWAAIAARKDGTGIYFDRPAGSSTGNQWGNNLIGPMGDTTFENSQVAEVNKFRNAMIGQSEYLRNPNGNNQVLMIERGNKGVVIINSSSSTLNLSSATTLANGTYTDQVSNRTFTVSGGTITGTVDAGKIAVVYNKTTSSTHVAKAGMASIQLPSGWGAPNIYVYDDSGSTVRTVAAWPGVAMTSNGTNIYSYTLPSGWTTAKVIFNYNGQQIPGANQPGFVLTNTEAMIYKNGSWQSDPIS
ncbi:MAG TPA: starch-binding protein, partial [Ruminiclostridium sp.]|nr:starch-binding protein [Ruminiclostridium sp.]